MSSRSELLRRCIQDPFGMAETLWEMQEAISRLENENIVFHEAIQRALDDEESGTGWGPDVTVCGYLRQALSGNNQETVK